MMKERFLVEFPKEFKVKWQQANIDRKPINESGLIKIEFTCVDISDAAVIRETNHMFENSIPLDLKLIKVGPDGFPVSELHLIKSKIKDMSFDFGEIIMDPEFKGPYQAVGYITIKPERVILK